MSTRHPLSNGVKLKEKLTQRRLPRIIYFTAWQWAISGKSAIVRMDRSPQALKNGR
jgi:hypothetical protein